MCFGSMGCVFFILPVRQQRPGEVRLSVVSHRPQLECFGAEGTLALAHPLVVEIRFVHEGASQTTRVSSAEEIFPEVGFPLHQGKRMIILLHFLYTGMF